MLGSIAGVIATVLQLFQINPLDWFAQDPTLFPDAPVFKGATSPTLGSLELKNKESRSSLETYFKLRESDDREDLELAANSLRKALRNERGTAPEQTLAYLEALEGKLQLDRGNWQEAIQRIEAANRRLPDDPYILDLLARTYDAAIRKLMAKRPWSEPVQEDIAKFTLRADELRRELRRLQAQALIHRPGEELALGLDVQCLGNCAAAHPAVTLLTLAGRGHDGDFGISDGVWHAEVRNTPRRLALLVGINDYGLASGFRPLSYAVRDVDRVAAGFGKDAYTTWQLTDHQATRENVLGALARATLDSRPGDELVFYFSGHGFNAARGGSAIVTVGPGPAGVDVIALREIESILSYHHGRATVIVDGCQTRMDVDLEAQGATVLWGANRPTVVLAGAPGGAAIESRRLGSSLFTESLLRRLTATATTATSTSPPAYRVKLWDTVAADTRELARELYGVEQRPQVYTSAGPAASEGSGSRAWRPAPRSASRGGVLP